MMKKWMKYMTGVFLTMLLAACYEDKGNYDYLTLHNVEIKNIENSYTAYVGKQFIIRPSLIYPNGPIENAIYEWRIAGNVVSREKDLDIKMTLVPLANIFADFSVINPENELKTMVTFKLDITSEFKSGWLLLCDMKTFSRLDYIQEDGTFYADIYNEINGEQLTAKPILMREHFQPWSHGIGQIMVITQEKSGAVELDGTNFARVVYTKDEFADAAPADFRPMSADYVTGWDYLVSNQKLYTRELLSGTKAQFQEGAYPGTPFYGDYLLNDWSVRGNPVFSQYVVYFDQNSRSFMMARDGELKYLDYVNDPEKKFNPLHMKSIPIAGAVTTTKTPTDFFLVIMKGDDFSINLYRFKFEGANKVYKSVGAAVFPRPELIHETTRFAICRNRPYLYFNSGNKLYAYNYETNSGLTELRDFGRTITNLAINPILSESLGITLQSETDSALSDFLVLDVSIVGGGKTKIEKKAITANVIQILYKLGDQWTINN